MKKNVTLCLLAVCFLATGCAMESNTASNEPAAEKEYPTGSNIPRRQGSSPSGVTTISKEAIDRLPPMAPPASPAAAGR
jgi:hypothetical protein